MLISPITSPIAQWSYDQATEPENQMSKAEQTLHKSVMAGHFVASVAAPAFMITMSNAHVMSYAYRGLPVDRFGTAAHLASRREFQMMSSKSYTLGRTIGRKVGLKTAAHAAGKLAFRTIPVVGWALFAYDAYDLVANRRLFGVQL